VCGYLGELSPFWSCATGLSPSCQKFYLWVPRKKKHIGRARNFAKSMVAMGWPSRAIFSGGHAGVL
jgi:hypothetical protein